MTREVKIRIIGDARDFSRAAQSVQNDARKMDSSFGSISDGANRMGSKFGSVVGKMAKVGAAALGTGLVVGFAAAAKSVASFQDSLNTLGAVSGASAAELKKVQDLSIELGNDLSLPGTSAADAADAMTELAKGGLSVAESMAAAKGVLQLSAAAQIENAEAATITANALNSFGLKAEEAIRVADLLAAAANASSAEISDVSLAMQQASAVFASANVPIEDLTTAIALMANAGVKGSDAGTSLKTMLTRILAPASNKARTAMEDLGVSIYDADGNFVGMRDTIKQFNRGLKGLSQEQRTAALNTIFGSDAIRAANIVLGKGTEAWDEMGTAVGKQGAAADVAGAKMKGLGGAIEGFKSVLETLVLQLGLKIGPPLEKFARWLSEVLPGAVAVASDWIEGFISDTLEQLSGWWDDNGDNIQEAARGIGDTLSAAFIWMAGVYEDYLKPAFDAITDWLTDSPGRMQAVAAIIGGVVVASFVAWAVSAAAAAAATALAIAPLVVVIALVVTLTGLTQYLIDKFELMPRASSAVQWLINHGLLNLLNMLVAIDAKLLNILGKFRQIGSLLPDGPWQGLGPSEADSSVVDNLFPNASKEGDRRSSGRRGPPERAMGGSVLGGSPYIVGERGRELFVPSTSGRIVSNRNLMGASRGSTTVVVQIGDRVIDELVVDSLGRVEARNGAVRVRTRAS